MTEITAEREGKGKTILVVDDDKNIRKIIAANLELAGYRVLAASSGLAALELLDVQMPDLILLDVMMPVMDGYEVCRRVRSRPLGTHVPVIMLTAKGESEDKVLGLDAGADDYITKPFGPAELLARVKAKLRRMAVDSTLQPLTRLPGNLAIEEAIKRRVASGEKWAILYLDLDNFKAFNDVYGFMHGDEAIKLVATVVVDAVREHGGEGDFVGHIGGDDFIVATQPRYVDAVCNAVIQTFDARIRTLYNERDLRQGYIETRDRRGTLNRYPIMSLSIAVVSNEHRPITSHHLVGEMAAELKRHAKSMPGSTYVRDKRRQ
ncbi:response regulator [bacterium]|nr:MAG: response regulator [bacterium]